jgi:hypothetical protein
MDSADIPFAVHWFEDSAAIARALGLHIDLPDVNNDSPDYWDGFDRVGWRRSLQGKVPMSPDELASSDPDWVRLKCLEHGIEVWFDLEEGIVFRCVARHIARVVFFIRRLAMGHDLRLEAETQPLVTASQSLAGGDLPYGQALRGFLAPAGFAWERCHWVLRSSQTPRYH